MFVLFYIESLQTGSFGKVLRSFGQDGFGKGSFGY